MPLPYGWDHEAIAAKLRVLGKEGYPSKQRYAIAMDSARSDWMDTHGSAPLPGHLKRVGGIGAKRVTTKYRGRKYRVVDSQQYTQGEFDSLRDARIAANHLRGAGVFVWIVNTKTGQTVRDEAARTGRNYASGGSSQFAKGYNRKHRGAAVMRLGEYRVGQLVPLPQGYGEWQQLGTYVVAKHELPYPIRVAGPTDKRGDALRYKQLGDFVLRVVEHERFGGVNWGQIIYVNPATSR